MASKYPNNQNATDMRFYILLFLSFCCQQLWSQDNKETTRIYTTQNNIAVVRCDIMARRLFSEGFVEVAPFNAKFALVRQVTKDTVLVRFLQWYKEKDTQTRAQFNDRTRLSAIDSMNPQARDTTFKKVLVAQGVVSSSIPTYFLMTKNDLDSGSVKTYTTGRRSLTFTAGIITMPMKLRLGKDFDFQGNISLGSTFGVKSRISKYNPNYLNFLFGASISTVTLDSVSTKGKVPGQPINNIAAFSPSLGIVMEFGRAQVGVFYGWDLVSKSTQDKYDWIYQGKPWLTLGFGVTIFNVDSKSATNEQTKQ